MSFTEAMLSYEESALRHGKERGHPFKATMPVVLKKGAWREFKIFLLLKGYATVWDSNISQKIFMILQGGEIRKRFLSAFPPLKSREKLDLSLDDIINPIEVFEDKSHKMGCHPGRLTLDPERYNRAWSEKRNGNPGYGYPQGPYGIPPHMAASRTGYLHSPSTGKHRLLDVSEEIDYPHRMDLEADHYEQRDLPWGLQDMYFLGGLPLEYWCNGDSMGMAVRSVRPCSETYQWPGTAFRAQTDEEAGCSGDFSRVTECCRTYCFSRMWYLPTEREWLTLQGDAWVGGGGFVEIYDRKPRTVGGNEWWTTAQAENAFTWPDNDGQELGHNAYIRYIQKIEDFDEAIRLDPQYAIAYSDRGLAYHMLGQYERAIEDFNKAIEITENSECIKVIITP